MLLPPQQKSSLTEPTDTPLSGNQLAHLACYICQSPMALLLSFANADVQGVQLLGVAGWEPTDSTDLLLHRLFEVIQEKSGDRAIAVKGITLYPPSLAAAFIEVLPAIKSWQAVGFGSSQRSLAGALVVLDTQPRKFQPEQLDLLRVLAQQGSHLQSALPTVAQTARNLPTAAPNALATSAYLLAEVEALRNLKHLSDGLQRCNTLLEVHDLLPELLSPIVQRTSGRLLLIDLPQTYLKEVVRWGTPPPLTHSCNPDRCPVVQGGHRCQCDDGWLLTQIPPLEGDRPLVTNDQGDLYSLCSPITLPNGTLIGIFSLWGKLPEAPLAQLKVQIDGVVEQIGFTLARIEHIEALQNQSIRDSLTGLFNRRYLNELLPQLLHRAGHGNYPVSLLLLDIDYFKNINDRFGHPAGDQVLRDFSLILKGFVRGTDIACRYGGEEFTLVLPDLSLHSAKQRAERIRQDLQYVTMRYGKTIIGTITLSAGVACFPEHGITAEDLIMAADQALYAAKSGGRNRVVIYDPTQSWNHRLVPPN